MLNPTSKLKTPGHRARIFRKNDVEHTHLCKEIWLYFGHFHIVTYQGLKF